MKNKRLCFLICSFQSIFFAATLQVFRCQSGQSLTHNFPRKRRLSITHLEQADRPALISRKLLFSFRFVVLEFHIGFDFKQWNAAFHQTQTMKHRSGKKRSATLSLHPRWPGRLLFYSNFSLSFFEK